MQTACAGRSGWFAHERRAAVGAGPAMDGWALDYARIYGRSARAGGGTAVPCRAQPGRRGGTADQGPRRLHVVEEGGDERVLRRLAVGEGVHVDVAAPLAQR